MGPRCLLAVSLALALSVATVASGAGGSNGEGEFTFYPQAGILWQDLYPNNFVDLDPGPGVRDYMCGTQTYDGHTGTDSDIRSFREMDIGVPVFAALDGRVIQVEDGQYDRRYGPTVTQFDNHVVVEHGTGRFTIYGHLRREIELNRGDRVVAGQQVGWTASSGSSSWPHLHFTSQVGGEVDEPFAGPCNEGLSGYSEQAPYPTEPYLRDLALSASPFTGLRDLPFDQAVRTGTFVRGTRTFYVRVELAAAFAPDPERLRLRVFNPSGVSLRGPTTSVRPAHGRGDWWFPLEARLGSIGRWRLVVDLDGKVLADAPFDVVATKSQVRNRPPNAVSVELEPAAPSPGRVVQCLIRTSLVREDPDYDIVRYRYRWTVGGKLVRAVQSAALSDVLRKGAAKADRQVRCTVTPSDGRRFGPTAAATKTSRY
jgi:murein DD-endopeptidase MepM/ murein hydrolase activator NlpD